jgi:NifB/MoaA-like Fe-S oxidoreductase
MLVASDIEPTSVAGKAGLRTGDVLVSIDGGEKLKDKYKAQRVCARCTATKSVHVLRSSSTTCARSEKWHYA